jgi:hypothetical protein
LATGACSPVYKEFRRVTNPPQVANLPHNFCRIPVARKLSGIGHECLRHIGGRSVRNAD